MSLRDAYLRVAIECCTSPEGGGLMTSAEADRLHEEVLSRAEGLSVVPHREARGSDTLS